MGKNKQDSEVLLELPELMEEQITSTNLVHRAVSYSLLLLLAVFVGTLIILFSVRTTTTVNANGILEPSGTRMVYSPESGTIVRVLAKPGDTMKLGQSVIQIDSTIIWNNILDLLAEIVEKRAEYERLSKNLLVRDEELSELAIQAHERRLKAKAYFRKSVADYQLRASPDSILVGYQVGQHVGLDIDCADVAVAEAGVRLAEQKKRSLLIDQLELHERLLHIDHLNNQLARLREQASKLTVVSPCDGIVMTDQLDRLVGTSVHQGDLLFCVANLDHWQATLIFEEGVVHQINVGDEARVEVSALYSLHTDLLCGVVRSISPEPFAAAQSTTSIINNRYRVVVDIDSSGMKSLGESRLRLGYSVIGKIITDTGTLYRVLWRAVEKNLSIFKSTPDLVRGKHIS